MPRRNRQTLKESFKQGKKPGEQDFENLIDSTLNILDDGFSKTPETGMGLAPLLEKGTVISVFKEPADPKPQWEIAINQERSLEIRRCESDNIIPVLILKPDGSIELGEESMKTVLKSSLQIPVREGNLYRGSVPADGHWHDITEDLDGYQALEIVAYTGMKRSGKHAILAATATVCFGAHPKIRETSSHYGSYGHKIHLRWKKSKHDFQAKLQVKTVFKYDNNTPIQFHITGLIRN
ncbi:MAG: hypothetical protein LBR97_05800 [Dysgonamonadaceae bacterium]|jgi:hypothetical protein|nr:hypothetical protein [Dysgonamonadaceae bacterium]